MNNLFFILKNCSDEMSNFLLYTDKILTDGL